MIPTCTTAANLNDWAQSLQYLPFEMDPFGSCVAALGRSVDHPFPFISHPRWYDGSRAQVLPHTHARQERFQFPHSLSFLAY